MDDPVREQRRLGLGMQIMAWLMVLALLTYYFSGVIERQHNPNTSVSTDIGEGGVREVVLERNRQGHYVTSGEINGKPVVFLLDTGATGIAISSRVAKELGIPRGRPFTTRTANGNSTSYATRLDSVSVGGIELNNVEAGITPGLQMREILLGMSFLRHIEFTQRGNTLTLRQYPQGGRNGA
ncbi:MAG: TIGR02281 family clan AA aspartic protease [Chromatocurvus sp.]